MSSNITPSIDTSRPSCQLRAQLSSLRNIIDVMSSQEGYLCPKIRNACHRVHWIARSFQVPEPFKFTRGRNLLSVSECGAVLRTVNQLKFHISSRSTSTDENVRRSTLSLRRWFHFRQYTLVSLHRSFLAPPLHKKVVVSQLLKLLWLKHIRVA